MARSRKNRSRAPQGSYRGGVSTPPSTYTPRRALSSSLVFSRRLYPLIRSTRLAASSSVLQNPAVRPLMRTVFTDTTFSRRTPRKVRPGVLLRRPSPDLPNRALARSNPWNTFLDKDWPVLSDQIPLQRATTCARRSIRREVLFAIGGRNGAGSRGVPKSKVKCT